MTASNLDRNPLPAVIKAASSKAAAQRTMSIQCRALRIVREVLLDAVEEWELVSLRKGFQDFYSALQQELEDSDDPADVQEQMKDCSDELAALSDDINTVRALFCSHK